MKTLQFLTFLFFAFFANAQTATIVLDVNLTNLEPINTSLKFSKSNFWKGKYYYSGKGTSTATLKLCATDGTAEGTTLIKEFNNPGYLKDIVAVKDFIYFLVDDTTNSAVSKKELWKSDGTEAGTVLIKLFVSNASINNQMRLVSDLETDENYSINENEIYFSGVTDGQGLELWKTNGTETSTVLVKDVYAGTNASDPSGFTRIGSTVYFAIAYYNVWPYTQLWKTDGTTAGTVGVGTQTYVLNKQIVPFKDKLYFFGFDGSNGIEPWVSNGTSAGTSMLLNTSPFTQFSYSGPFRVLKADDYLVFAQENFAQNSTTNHFWKSDGTSNGTLRMTPDNGLRIFFNAFGFKNYAIDKNFFYAYDSSKVLYKFNLQNNTNQSIALPYSLEGVGNWLKVYNSELYLTYRTTANGTELWKTDFQTVGMYQDINVGSPSSTPFSLFTNNNNFYFFANNGPGNKLYSLNKDVVFNGNVNTNWNVTGNWNTNTIPISADNVIIPTNKNVTVDANAFAKNLTVNSPVNLVSGNLEINGLATLRSKITLNTNQLNLKGNNSMVTGNPTSYIVTNATGKVVVENIDLARGLVNVPIGTTANFNPIAISNSGTADTFSLNVQDGISNTTNGAVNATWNIDEATAGNSNTTIILSWNEAQESSLFNRNLCKVGHYYNGTWNAEYSSIITGTNPYSITADGITSFSPFGVLNQSLLAVNDFSKNTKSLSVFPNPTSSNINLQLSQHVDYGNLKIISLLGQTVFEKQNLSGVDFNLDVSNLNSGLYLIQLSDGNQIYNAKFIKK